MDKPFADLIARERERLATPRAARRPARARIAELRTLVEEARRRGDHDQASVHYADGHTIMNYLRWVYEQEQELIERLTHLGEAPDEERG